MKRFRFVINLIFTISLLFVWSCENDEEKNNITIEAAVPASIRMGESDTLKFNISSDIVLLRVDLLENTKLLARFKENILKKNTKMPLNFIYTPGSTGAKNLELLVINKEYYNKTYEFSIEITE